MKSFSTYLELKEKWTISQFIESLFQVYGIEYQDIDYNQKRIENHCYDIYQYPHDGSVVVHLYHRMNTFIMKKREVYVFIMMVIKKDIGILMNYCQNI